MARAAALGLGLSLFALPVAASAEMREPAVAGSFYAGSAPALKKDVQALLAGASTPAIASSARMVGLVLPHAGHVYSGATAALGFKAIAGQRFDRIYLLGVDHHSGLPTVSVWPEGGYATPLGPVPADASASAALKKAGAFITTEPAQHLQEHSIEVLLPFYLETLGPQPAVFVTAGGSPENGIALGKALIKQLEGFSGRCLIVASSDWSHYHPATRAAVLDRLGIDAVLALDPERLLQRCREGKTELCGLNGVLALTTVMKAARAKTTLLEQTDSSRASGDRERVVGYAAISMVADIADLARPGSGAATQTTSVKEEVPVELQKQALNAIRATLESVLKGGSIPTVDLSHSRFAEHCGVFVTLKKDGELRGCIGLVEGRQPLGKGIQEMAVAAATEDPRFNPVTFEELKEISIEVSILSPMIPVSDVSEIKVGRDGLLLKKFPNSGLLLPQVATEWGWDRDEFLKNLCMKAGLPPGSHIQPGAKLFRFTAEVFGEHE